MPDDPGMSIEYDELSGTVTVTFRGKKTVLPSSLSDLTKNGLETEITMRFLSYV